MLVESQNTSWCEQANDQREEWLVVFGWNWVLLWVPIPDPRRRIAEIRDIATAALEGGKP